jgi:hypothetical protein
MQDVDGGAVAGGEAIEALEEGHQRARPIDDRVGALIQLERHFCNDAARTLALTRGGE